ncbi:MAG TPA: carboxypeptidase-like regulatory domain-containing protein, partial [Bacteroidales bacterium]|nr:carboxypeptidase-like regulatory domain-containing protein [Bacteroidales bacterium]
METFILYMAKSALWLTGFAAVYLLFLRNERFFLLNRLYLLTGIIVSFAFPFITIHYQVEVPAGSQNGIVSVLPVTEDAIAEAKGNMSGTSLLSAVMFIIYLSGVLFLLYRILWHLLLLRDTIRRAGVNCRGSIKLVRVSGFPSSFSFFNYIFIDPAVGEDEAEEIMNHELAHVRQNHWFDLLLCELLRAVQWINPFSWIYSGLIRQNHEYLADEQALQVSANPALYRAALINQLFNSKVISLTNSFNYSLNKKRFHMMKKTETSPFRKFKVLLILPVFAIILYSFSEPEYRYININENPGAGNPVAGILSEGSKAADKGSSDALPVGSGISTGEAVQKTGAGTEVIIPVSAIMPEGLRGVIVRKDGKPLEGAVIVIKGTTTGTISDNKGFFQLDNVPDDAVLVVSYVGFKTMVLKPVFGSGMKISMVQDTIKVLNNEAGIP